MGKIQIMDEWLSNKIAAGEVVERPSSVVKELVENAIDAGSSSIEVFLEEAGLTSIQVIDNGVGMDEEDALKAFFRHATSKISKEQDLFRIRTLGFRGEALASIASVSKIHLRTSDGETGMDIELEGGHIVSQKPSQLRRGTDITVSQLFYNTPARLKYLKTIQTELSHTTDFMNRIALCYPNIAFKLVHNGSTLLQTNGTGNVQQVLASIYGMPIAKKMIPFEAESKDYKIHGYATLPEVTRASKNYISLFVNGRWVKHYVIQKTIIDAYHTFLPIERFPIVVLYIEGDPYLTDVNVHPAKHQIRLSKEPDLLELVKTTIRDAIRKSIHVPQMEKKEKVKPVASVQMNIWNNASFGRNMQELAKELQTEPVYKPTTSMRADEVPFPEVVEPVEDVQNPMPVDGNQSSMLVGGMQDPMPVDGNQNSMSVGGMQNPMPVDGIPNSMLVDETRNPMQVADSAQIDEMSTAIKPETSSPESDSSSPKKEPFPPLEVVGQIHGTYIVAQMEDGFFLIDQHAAQERIKYEYFREKVGEVNPNERQALLLPLTFHYSKDEALILQENIHCLEEVGVYLEDFGHSTFVVREHPTWFPKGFEQEIIEQLIEQVLNDKKADVKKLREDAAILMSCKRSIKANHYLSKEQMERLLEDLRKAENPFTCPHGRPVLIHFTTYEIEKMFKRVM